MYGNNKFLFLIYFFFILNPKVGVKVHPASHDAGYFLSFKTLIYEQNIMHGEVICRFVLPPTTKV